jgi:hypothetical protein
LNHAYFDNLFNSLNLGLGFTEVGGVDKTT